MWKDIKGYENKYQVNEFGEVKSLSRHIENGSKNGMDLPERILKQTKSPNGYMQVSLRDGRTRKVKYVHILVAEAFLNKENNLDVVNHIDGNKENNNLYNLEYCTYSYNNLHALNNNLRKGKCENHYLAVLTKENVKQIRQQGKYDTYRNIARIYGVKAATIRDVLLGNTWKDVS